MFLTPKPFELVQLSVSQLELFARCPRRWWFQKVCGIKEPSSPAQAAGTASHALLDHTVSKGEDVLGPLESPARPFLPRPGDEVFCEWGFDDKPRVPGQHWHDAGASLLRVAGVPFIGFIDLWHMTGRTTDERGAPITDPPNTVEVLDYKTTSSIQRNAKAGFQLPKTIQMAGYNAWAAARVPSARMIRDSHVYIQTRGAPRAEKRSALIGVDDALKIWETLSGPLVEGTRQVAQESTQAVVPHNPDDCESYGRQCPAFAVCTRRGERMSANLVERMRAAKATSEAMSPGLSKPANPPMRIIDESTSPDRPVGSAPSTPPAAGGLPPGTSIIQSPVPLTVGSKLDTGESIVADLTGGQYLIMAAPAVQAPPKPATPPPPSTKPAPSAPPAAAVQAPPPPSRRNPETGAAEFLNPATGRYEAEPAGSAVAAEDVKQLPPMAAPADPPTAVSGEAPKRGRGRPPKVKDTPLPIRSMAAQADLDQHLGTPAPFHAARFGDYVAALAEGLAKECGLDDIRLALDGSHALAFGRWKGALSVLCRESPPAPGGYIVDLSGELEAVAFEALAPRAVELGLTLFVGCFPVAPGIVRAR